MRKLAVKLLVVAGLFVGTTGASVVALPAKPAAAAPACNYFSWGVQCTETTVITKQCASQVWEPALVPVFNTVWTWAASKWSQVKVFGGWATVLRAATKWEACNRVVTKTCTNTTSRTPCTPK
ncbi:MAG: hypothetical protein AAF962_08995 [Actinomycetota bacterium]